ncbi:metal ABC transporter solute-binding protein, Zn/Mn family [Chitinimonas taiwanensis]|uniref:metal ABC transporter solute-binding protein, Zn/Mn family n=1 Tax=Chitinimonas taiwanensis TaxID=240412 RepID=UPI0035B049A4
MRSKLAALLLGLAGLPACAALNVFACEPEWAALVRILAPDAKLFIATHAGQDPHHIEARPALISQLRQADLAICTGASLEAGWLPLLQQKAANPRVQAGQPGLFFAAEQVELLDAHQHVDRSMGDVHAEGNPHLHLDPRRMLRVAQALSTRLGQLDPAQASVYQQRFGSWAEAWRRQVLRWEERASALEDRALIAQHSSFAYLWHWLNLRQVADLEPKPGLPPSVVHLRKVLQSAQQAQPFVIVQTSYQDPQPARWLAGQIKLPVLSLPATVDSQRLDLNAWYEGLLTALLNAAMPAGRP